MKHFTVGKWIDFANEIVTKVERKSMESHLESCKQCAETISIWQKVRKKAAAEGTYQPPADTVRVVKSAFSGAGLTRLPKGARSRVAVLFDSFLQPMIAGARSGTAGTRQMLYRAEPFQIDLQIEAKDDGRRIVVTGQLLDLGNSNNVGRDVPVTLSNMRGSIAHTMTNQFGEFRAEVVNGGDLQLTFMNLDKKPVVISLRDALGKWPEQRS